MEYEFQYEPYVMMKTADVVHYPEFFLGRYYDKASFFVLLALQKWVFWHLQILGIVSGNAELNIAFVFLTIQTAIVVHLRVNLDFLMFIFQIRVYYYAGCICCSHLSLSPQRSLGLLQVGMKQNNRYSLFTWFFYRNNSTNSCNRKNKEMCALFNPLVSVLLWYLSMCECGVGGSGSGQGQYLRMLILA